MPEKMPSETPAGAGAQGKVDAVAQVAKASAAGATNAPKDAKANSPVNKGTQGIVAKSYAFYTN
jgi:hypothetical protein